MIGTLRVLLVHKRRSKLPSGHPAKNLGGRAYLGPFLLWLLSYLWLSLRIGDHAVIGELPEIGRRFHAFGVSNQVLRTLLQPGAQQFWMKTGCSAVIPAAARNRYGRNRGVTQ